MRKNTIFGLMARAGLLLLLVGPLGANALFFFIPGKLISDIADAATGSEGEHCVSESAKVGDRISLPGGGFLRIKSLSGTSIRCSNPKFPVRALLLLEQAEATSALPTGPLNESPQVKLGCSPEGAIVDTPLSDPTRPPPCPPAIPLTQPPAVNQVSPIAESSPKSQQVLTPVAVEIKPAPAVTVPPIPDTKAQPNMADPVERLKQLNRLRDNGLISDKEFEEKRRKILDQL
jgi:hypothetical protein